MAIEQHRLEVLFDEVAESPVSARGYDIGETCRLLAESIKRQYPKTDYEEALKLLEEIYLERFLHTRSVDPDLTMRIRSGIRHYL